jgi:hypothetical protein
MQRLFFLGMVFFCVWAKVWAEDTELVLYRPMTETSRHPTVVLAAKKTGQCQQQSQQIKREDAWQCTTAEGQTYDPCFVKPFGDHLEAVCIASPFAKEGIQLTVASPLNNREHEKLDMSRALPWAVELSSGERCERLVSNEVYDQLPVNYHCDHETKLIGHIQRCQNEWSVLQKDQQKVNNVVIRRAWF